MAADTANKRFAAVAIRLIFRSRAASPDGTIDLGDRRQLLSLYRFVDGTVGIVDQLGLGATVARGIDLEVEL